MSTEMKIGDKVVIIHEHTHTSMFGFVHEKGEDFFSVSVFSGMKTLVFHCKSEGNWYPCAHGNGRRVFCSLIPN